MYAHHAALTLVQVTCCAAWVAFALEDAEFALLCGRQERGSRDNNHFIKTQGSVDVGPLDEIFGAVGLKLMLREPAVTACINGLEYLQRFSYSE